MPEILPLSRFQGGLIGSLLPNPKILPWQEIGHYGLLSLIALGDLDPDHWLNLIQQKQPDLLDLKNKANNSQLILAILPLIIFFADNLGNLDDKIEEASQIWLDSPVQQSNLEEIKAWADIFALNLQGKLKKDIFQQILKKLKPESEFKQQLEYLHTAWQENQPSYLVVKNYRGKIGEIGLSLYYFAQTPQDFPLCVTRCCHNTLTANLTGALAGVYNGWEGIPVSWRLKATKNAIMVKVKQEAELLFKTWSGVYQPEITELSPTTAIAFPSQIQNRPSLKIISQQPD